MMEKEKKSQKDIANEILRIRNERKNELSLRKATKDFFNLLVERCLIISQSYRYSIQVHNTTGRYNLLRDDEYNLGGYCTFMNVIDIINVEYLNLFWETFDSFVKTARNIGFTVDVSQKLTFDNITFVAFKISV